MRPHIRRLDIYCIFVNSGRFCVCYFFLALFIYSLEYFMSGILALSFGD